MYTGGLITKLEGRNDWYKSATPKSDTMGFYLNNKNKIILLCGCSFWLQLLFKMITIEFDIPALEKANLEFREMQQTRHSFASCALSCGESPLWIAKVMGHRDTEMIIKVYGKYIENTGGVKDGSSFEAIYQGFIGKEEKE